jgi:hypothetical protein
MLEYTCFSYLFGFHASLCVKSKLACNKYQQNYVCLDLFVLL